MKKFVISAFADEAAESLDGQIEALKRNGLKHIEIRNISGKCVIDCSDEELAFINDKLALNGITVSAIGSPIGKCDILNPFEKELLRFKKAVNAAKKLSTSRIRMFSFFVPKGENADNYTSEVVKRLEVFTDIAEAYGVSCYHENEKEIYGDKASRVLKLFNSNNKLKGIFDPANYIQCGENPIEIADSLMPYTDYMHIKDAFIKDGSVCPCNKGDGNIPKLIELFGKKGNGLLLTVEPHLAVFSGLRSLQSEEVKHSFTYSSAAEAFDTAVSALKKILEEKGYSYE